jgi:hypothetical protein
MFTCPKPQKVEVRFALFTFSEETSSFAQIEPNPAWTSPNSTKVTWVSMHQGDTKEQLSSKLNPVWAVLKRGLHLSFSVRKLKSPVDETRPHFRLHVPNLPF